VVRPRKRWSGDVDIFVNRHGGPQKTPFFPPKGGLIGHEHMLPHETRHVCNIGHRPTKSIGLAEAITKWDTIKAPSGSCALPDGKRSSCSPRPAVNLGPAAPANPRLRDEQLVFTNQCWPRSSFSPNRRLRQEVYVLPKHLDEMVARLPPRKDRRQSSPELRPATKPITSRAVEGPYTRALPVLMGLCLNWVQKLPNLIGAAVEPSMAGYGVDFSRHVSRESLPALPSELIIAPRGFYVHHKASWPLVPCVGRPCSAPCSGPCLVRHRPAGQWKERIEHLARFATGRWIGCASEELRASRAWFSRHGTALVFGAGWYPPFAPDFRAAASK